MGRQDGRREEVGRIVGEREGHFDGIAEGILVIADEGIALGPFDRDFFGFFVGADVGITEDKYKGTLEVNCGRY